MKIIYFFIFTIFITTWTTSAMAASDTGKDVSRELYANRKVLPDPTAGACPDTERTLTKVRDNLYRHTSGTLPALHSGLVLITKEGAVVIDPASTCTARWLNDEIKKRFNVKVRYVIETHGHFDHIAGSQVFQEKGATVVAHRNAVEPIVGEKLPTAVPDKVFDKEMKIEIGGETVNLYHIAPSHSNSMVMVHFPKQKALQCTDVCESKTMPYMDFLDFYYDGWIKTLDWVIAQDVDIIDVGHYTLSNREDQRALRNYMVDLHDQVLSLVRQGQTWDQVWRNVKFKPEYQKWFGYDTMRVPNIHGMHRWVVNHRRGVW
ncbi:MBL fold metallo-hydrolase [Peribacillus loiseleuriae]|uniref:MBL fold metallo-hydrolase n=1 Tax=Peribacillus loiseleuriae TaxID=1679170 RepID=UPI003D04D548